MKIIERRILRLEDRFGPADDLPVGEPTTFDLRFVDKDLRVKSCSSNADHDRGAPEQRWLASASRTTKLPILITLRGSEYGRAAGP